MGDEATAEASAARRWLPTASTTRCWTRPRRGRSRCTACRPTPARRSRRGALRLAPADLGPGREPPPRAEGAARAAGRPRSRWRRRDAARSAEHPTRLQSSRPPERGEELELTIDSLAFGGEGVARWATAAMSCSSPAPSPATACARSSQAQAQLRPRAHARGPASRAPSGSPPRAEHPGAPWQVLPYERQLEIKQARSRRRCGGSAGSTASSSSRSCRRSNSGATATSSSTPSATDRTRGARVRLPRPGGLEQVLAIDDCLLASERATAPASVACAGVASRGLSAWERGGRGGGRGGRQASEDARSESRKNPPRRPTASRRAGPPTGARSGAGPDGRALLRNLVVREGRRTGRLQVRLVTTEGELDARALAAALARAGRAALDGVLWTRSRRLAETTAGGETELVGGEAELPERLGELDLRISAEAFFQTNTEMAEVLYGIAAEYAALEGWERVYDLYCGIGTIALTLAPRAGELWGLELVEEAVADAIAARPAQRDHKRPLLRRRRAPGAARAARARRASGRDRPRPAARRTLQEGRAPHHRGRSQADRLRLLQPHHAGPQRRRSSSRPAGRSQGAPGRHVPPDAHIECVALFERGARPRASSPGHAAGAR